MLTSHFNKSPIIITLPRRSLAQLLDQESTHAVTSTSSPVWPSTTSIKPLVASYESNLHLSSDYWDNGTVIVYLPATLSFLPSNPSSTSESLTGFALSGNIGGVSSSQMRARASSPMIKYCYNIVSSLSYYAPYYAMVSLFLSTIAVLAPTKDTSEG